MPELEGSCHCKAVRFSVKSHTPQPYMRCYCSVCRKTAGGGGYAINLMGEAGSLEIEGRDHMGVYHATGVGPQGDQVSPAERYFCKKCGSALYVFDPRWTDLVHPFASAIDTPLPRPAELVHIMLESKPDWVEAPAPDEENCFAGYPKLSIEDWHKAQGVYEA